MPVMLALRNVASRGSNPHSLPSIVIERARAHAPRRNAAFSRLDAQEDLYGHWPN